MLFQPRPAKNGKGPKLRPEQTAEDMSVHEPKMQLREVRLQNMTYLLAYLALIVTGFAYCYRLQRLNRIRKEETFKDKADADHILYGKR